MAELDRGAVLGHHPHDGAGLVGLDLVHDLHGFDDAKGVAFLHLLGARPATNAWVTLIMQRIVRHLVFNDEVPDIFFVPTQQRIDFHQIEIANANPGVALIDF